MSAFQVSPNHIATILNTYAAHSYSRMTEDQLIEIAEILAHENAVSVNYRYNDDVPPVDVTTDVLAESESVSAVAALKLIDCLEYQSCEHGKDWLESEAFGFCEQFKAVLTKALPLSAVEVRRQEAAARWSI